jgi:hypothetical protein
MMSRVDAMMPMIRAEWERHGATLRAGVTDAEIGDFQRKRGVELPEDVADFFRAVDGMNEGDCDQLGVRFWSLDELRPVVEELPATDGHTFKGYFVFGDYSMWAHGYAVRLDRIANDVIIVGGQNPIPIAPSFREFLQLYLAQPDRLFPGNTRAH